MVTMATCNRRDQQHPGYFYTDNVHISQSNWYCFFSF